MSSISLNDGLLFIKYIVMWKHEKIYKENKLPTRRKVTFSTGPCDCFLVASNIYN
jgi:hypothetical protein